MSRFAVSLKQHPLRAVPTVDSAALVRRAQQGDPHAFAQLYKRYAGVVHSIALARMRAEDADDAVQEVFLRALGKIRTLRDPDAFAGWLVTIAKNTVLNLLQRSPSVSSVEYDIAVPEGQHAEIDAGRAMRAIRALPRAYRDTLIMRLVYGMSGPEIAKRTGMTAASVRVNLHRGMKLLRERLQPLTEAKPA